jgi:hypothetical protein
MWSVRLTISPQKIREGELRSGDERIPEDIINHSWIPVSSLVNDELEEIYMSVLSSPGDDCRVFDSPQKVRGTFGFGGGWGSLGHLTLSSFPLIDMCPRICEHLSYNPCHENPMWAVDVREFGIAIEVDADTPENASFERSNVCVFELERKMPSPIPPPAIPSTSKPHISDPVMITLLLMMTTTQNPNPFNKV